MSLLTQQESSILNTETPDSAPVSDWREKVARRTREKPWWTGREAKPMKLEVVDFILKTAQECPHFSHGLLAALTKEKFGETEAPSVSSIGKILSRCGLGGSRESPLLQELEARLLAGNEWMPPVWRRKLLNRNPALAELSRETQAPGERVCQAWYPLASYAGFGFHVHVTVDTYGGFATGDVFCGMETDFAVALLEQHTLPVYEEAGVRIRELETKSSRTYTANTLGYSYAGFLKLHQIEHHVRASYEMHNGFLLKFKQSLLLGYLLLWRHRFESVEKRGRPLSSEATAKRVREKLLELREAFASWLDDYNNTPQEGYRNKGKSPLEFWKTR